MKKIVLLSLSIFLSCGLVRGINIGIDEGDSLALVALYNQTNGPEWFDNTNWLQPGSMVKDWYGINLLGNRVDQIWLPNNNLTGQIPIEIGNMDLRVLNLGYNQLSGSIPSSIGNLTNITGIYLHNNLLSEPIPTEILSISSLQELSLQNNFLTFFDLEPINTISLTTFAYDPQYQIPFNTKQINVSSGDNIQLDISTLSLVEITAVRNDYTWQRNGVSITKSVSVPYLDIVNIGTTDAGYYDCTINNSDFPSLSLYSDSLLLVVDGPMNIFFDPGAMDENLPPGTVIGILIADDPDQLSGHSFQLVPGNGTNDADNALFSISGEQLVINSSPDFETKPEYHIYVRATDSDSKTLDKELVIPVNDLPEVNAIRERMLNGISIFPNPTDGFIEILVPENIADFDIEVLDVMGRSIVQEKKYTKNGIKMYGYPAGIYYLKISHKDLFIVRKVIKK